MKRLIIAAAILLSANTVSAQDYTQAYECARDIERISRYAFEYVTFLTTQWEEAEDPCEVAEISSNPFLVRWFNRFCQ